VGLGYMYLLESKTNNTNKPNCPMAIRNYIYLLEKSIKKQGSEEVEN